jgi:cytochrome c oxidase cbb3-type subunit I/II
LAIYNLLKTAGQGHFEADEAVEAPARTHLADVKGVYWHRWIEKRPVQMLLLSLVVISVGGIVQIVPMVWVDDNTPKIETVKPYTPLELAGRDIYVREGCMGCHSQMVRPMRFETERYGEYSKSGEFVYDRPFLWGSKRNGPDLAREGVGKLKKSDSWHYNHLIDPTSTSPGSIMPAYPWLAKNDLNGSGIPAKIKTLRTLGTPYIEGYEQIALDDLVVQAKRIAKSMKTEGVMQEGLENKEIIAVIAYLQKLGTDITASKSLTSK